MGVNWLHAMFTKIHCNYVEAIILFILLWTRKHEFTIVFTFDCDGPQASAGGESAQKGGGMEHHKKVVSGSNG